MPPVPPNDPIDTVADPLDVSAQVQLIAKSIYADFTASLGNSVVLNAEQQAIVVRATERISRAFVVRSLTPAHDAEAAAEFGFIVGGSNAAIEAIKIANQQNAVGLFRRSVERVLSEAFSLGGRLLRAYVAGFAGLPPV